jgi:hypothetical protein
MHTHKQTHTHTHTYTHIYIHAYIYIYVHTYTCTANYVSLFSSRTIAYAFPRDIGTMMILDRLALHLKGERGRVKKGRGWRKGSYRDERTQTR